MVPIKNAPLEGRLIAVPESRQLDVLQSLLERRGAKVSRCPLITIVDSPNVEEVVTWLENFIEQPSDYLILLTGEGLRRLLGFAANTKQGVEQFVSALKSTKIISRGPKPARELRQYQLTPTFYAASPTTAGVIDTLQSLDIANQRIAVQLYGDDPNTVLMNYLNKANAKTCAVAPYRYAAELSETSILQLIQDLEKGMFDAILFTSKAQIQRLFKIAELHDCTSALRVGLTQSVIAGIGPIVAEELATYQVDVDIQPEEKYFMKPLVNALCDYFV